MDKKEEILRKHIGDDYYDAWSKQWHLDNCPIDAPLTTVADVIQAAMEEYAQNEKLRLAHIVLKNEDK